MKQRHIQLLEFNQHAVLRFLRHRYGPCRPFPGSTRRPRWGRRQGKSINTFLTNISHKNNFCTCSKSRITPWTAPRSTCPPGWPSRSAAATIPSAPLALPATLKFDLKSLMCYTASLLASSLLQIYTQFCWKYIFSSLQNILLLFRKSTFLFSRPIKKTQVFTAWFLKLDPVKFFQQVQIWEFWALLGTGTRELTAAIYINCNFVEILHLISLL